MPRQSKLFCLVKNGYGTLCPESAIDEEGKFTFLSLYDAFLRLVLSLRSQTVGCWSSYSNARCCRHVQIFLYVSAFVLGFLVFIPIGQIVKEYKIMGCILFANVSYVLSGMTVTRTGGEDLRDEEEVKSPARPESPEILQQYGHMWQRCVAYVNTIWSIGAVF